MMLFRLVLLWLATISATLQALDAGSAKVQLEPPLGAPLNGYGDRLGRGALAAHDPLWARALYLNDGTTQILLVNADLCMINRDLRNRVLELAPSEVPRENVILTATHTHNGPGGMHRHLPMRFISGRFMPEVLEGTAKAISLAMRAAVESKRRGSIGFGLEKQQAISRNRSQNGGPIDEQIGVIRVDDADGNPIAIVANFAAHPTSVPEEDRYSFSADYVGFYYDELERLSAAGCVAMFLNGAQGNQTIGNPERKEGWEHTASIGRLLAVRVKGIANDIACSDLTLRVASNHAALPPTIAHSWQPESVLLQTLEIGDLLLTFFPGEPVVEMGLEIRRRALAAGYSAQFSVGLANDYLMYFVPRDKFGENTYESAMNFYGPRIADWFYGQFGQLSSRDMAVSTPASSPDTVAVAPEELDGMLRIVLQGTPREMGAQRGRAFAEDIRVRYTARVEQGLAVPALLPEDSLWSAWPAFLDPSPVAVPMVAMAARPMTHGLPEYLFEELEGMAEATQLSFDGMWLLQHAIAFRQRKDTAPLFDSPLCTMFVAMGPRAGAEPMLIGRNLDWPEPEIPVVVEVRPETGRRFVQVGFSWNAGVYTGMNDAGLVLMAERTPLLGDPLLTGPPVEFILRRVLQETGSYSGALAILREQSHLRGYTVLIAGEEAGEYFCAAVEFGARLNVRGPEEGLLLGVEPAGEIADFAAAARYGRLHDRLQGAQVLSVRDMQATLGDAVGSPEPLHRIWNSQTHHSVVFEPARRRLHVSVRNARGEPGTFQTINLRAGGG